jgi:hypothetical protein
VRTDNEARKLIPSAFEVIHKLEWSFPPRRAFESALPFNDRHGPRNLGERLSGARSRLLSDQRDLIGVLMLVRGPVRAALSTPSAFSACARLRFTKSRRESFEAGGEAVEVREIGGATARYARDRGVTHRNFPNYSARRKE